MAGNAFSDSAALGQIEFLEDALRRSILRHEAVQNARVEARRAFEELKRTLHALDTEADSLDASMAVLRSDISARRLEIDRASQDARTARVRHILARFPHELLRCIFLQAMVDVELDEPDDEQWGQYFYKAKSRLPFALASVCRRWRAVALQTTALWAFVGVGPLDDRDDGLDVAHVRLLLARSKKRPLDIALAWSVCEWSKSTQYAAILVAVGRHARRWRRVSITFPRGTPEQALHILRLPMPILEGLSLRRDEDEDMISTTTPSMYLPFCPNLRRLHNTVLFVIPGSPLAQLTDVQVSVDSSSPDDVWTLLQAIPSVHRLRLFFALEQDMTLPDVSLGPLNLPHLRSLSLTGWCEWFSPWVDLLQMPALDELLTDAEAADAYTPLFDKVSDTMRTLILHLVSESTPFPAAHLGKLRNLRYLTLLSCTTFPDDYRTALSSRETAGLPRLERIFLQYPKLNEASAANVSSLMRSLHVFASAEDGAVAFKLALEFSDDVPEWLLQQSDFIAGQGNGT